MPFSLRGFSLPSYAPHLFALPAQVERFRFVGWGGSGFVPASAWVLPGYELCGAAAELDVSLPKGTALHLVSSTRGWLSQASGTGAEWFNFLNCPSIEPWASHFQNYGHA